MSIRAIEQMLKASRRLEMGDKSGFESEVSVLRELNSGRSGKVLSALENSIAREEEKESSGAGGEAKESQPTKLGSLDFSTPKDPPNYIYWSERRDETCDY